MAVDVVVPGGLLFSHSRPRAGGTHVVGNGHINLRSGFFVLLLGLGALCVVRTLHAILPAPVRSSRAGASKSTRGNSRLNADAARAAPIKFAEINQRQGYGKHNVRQGDAATLLHKLREEMEAGSAQRRVWRTTLADTGVRRAARAQACLETASRTRLPTIWPIPRAMRRAGVDELPLRDASSGVDIDGEAGVCVAVSRVSIRYVPASLELSLDGKPAPRLSRDDATALVFGQTLAAAPPPGSAQTPSLACGAGTLEVLVRRVANANDTKRWPDGAYELAVRATVLDQDDANDASNEAVARASVAVADHRGLVYAMQTLAQLIEPPVAEDSNATSAAAAAAADGDQKSRAQHHHHHHHHQRSSMPSCAPASVLRALPLTVSDAPVWRHRGISVTNACSSAYSTKRLATLVQLASALKLNVLHVHLTNDNGYRIPHTHDSSGSRLPHDTGSCSFDALRSLGETAAKLGVSVVPGMEVPGQASSWGRLLASQCPLTLAGGSPLRMEKNDVHMAVAGAMKALLKAFPRAASLHMGGDPGERACWERAARLYGDGNLPRAKYLANVRSFSDAARAALKELASGADAASLARRAGMSLNDFLSLAERSSAHEKWRRRGASEASALYRSSLYHFYRLLYSATLPSIKMKASDMHHWEAILSSDNTGGYSFPRGGIGPVVHARDASSLDGSVAEAAMRGFRVVSSVGWNMNTVEAPLGCSTWFECYQNSLRHGYRGHAILPQPQRVVAQMLGGEVGIVDTTLGDALAPTVLAKIVAASERLWRDPPLASCDADSVRERLDVMAAHMRLVQGIDISGSSSLDIPSNVSALEQHPCRMGKAWWDDVISSASTTKSPQPPPPPPPPFPRASVQSRLQAFACLLFCASAFTALLTRGCRVSR